MISIWQHSPPLTKSITRTGRLGIWSNPSSNMGTEAAAATAAGTIAVQYMFNREPFPLGFLMPWNTLALFVVVDSEPIRRATMYTTASTAKDRKAIVRAISGQGTFEWIGLLECTYGNLRNVREALQRGRYAYGIHGWSSVVSSCILRRQSISSKI